MSGEIVTAEGTVPAVRQFVEEEFLGVEGVRCSELFARWNGDEDVLTKAVREIATRRRYKDGYYFEWKPWGDLEVDTALRRLLGFTEWLEFFVGLCDAGPEKLRGQVWQFEDELADRGVCGLRRSTAEDALLEFAAAFLPDSLAGTEDYKSLFFREAVTWLDQHSGYEAVKAAYGDPEQIEEAWQLSIPEFREFLRRRARETMVSGAKEEAS